MEEGKGEGRGEAWEEPLVRLVGSAEHGDFIWLQSFTVQELWSEQPATALFTFMEQSQEWRQVTEGDGSDGGLGLL